MMHTSFRSCFSLNRSLKFLPSDRILPSHPFCFDLKNGFFSSPLRFCIRKLDFDAATRKRQRGRVVVEAKKKKKVDTRSFVMKPDEATGPFPEAILLKKGAYCEETNVPLVGVKKATQLSDCSKLDLYIDTKIAILKLSIHSSLPSLRPR